MGYRHTCQLEVLTNTVLLFPIPQIRCFAWTFILIGASTIRVDILVARAVDIAGLCITVPEKVFITPTG